MSEKADASKKGVTSKNDSKKLKKAEDVIRIIHSCQFDEFKNAVKAGTIDVNHEYPTQDRFCGTTMSFTYNAACDLDNRIKWIKLFASLGADLNRELPTLIRKSDESDIIRAFAELGVDIHKKDQSGLSLIFHAADHGTVEQIKCLAELGADVNARDNDDWTPVFHTLNNEKVDNMRCLVELGADINAKDNNGRTAAINAAGFNRVDSIKCLMSLGADFTIKADDGSTPLSYAKLCGHGGNTKIAKLLKDYGVK